MLGRGFDWGTTDANTGLAGTSSYLGPARPGTLVLGACLRPATRSVAELPPEERATSRVVASKLVGVGALAGNANPERHGPSSHLLVTKWPSLISIVRGCLDSFD